MLPLASSAHNRRGENDFNMCRGCGCSCCVPNCPPPPVRHSSFEFMRGCKMPSKRLGRGSRARRQNEKHNPHNRPLTGRRASVIKSICMSGGDRRESGEVWTVGVGGVVLNVPFSCRNQDLLNNLRLCVVLQTTRSLLSMQAADDVLQQQEELRLVTRVTSCLEISAVRRVQQQQRERKCASGKSPKNRS